MYHHCALTNNNIFHLVQQDPGESVLLGTYESKQTALFKLGKMQMRNPHCFYEITTSEEYLAGLTVWIFLSP